jgi:hypothetical protein
LSSVYVETLEERGGRERYARPEMIDVSTTAASNKFHVDPKNSQNLFG